MSHAEYREGLTTRQQQALDQLERAFARCAREGLVFVGMDHDLLAARSADVDRTMQKTGYLMQQDAMCSVDTSETYLDSGGW